MEKTTIISEGRTSTEAIEKGLKELGCRKDDVEIKVLENEEKRSFYSILAPRVVKVELTLKEGIKINKNNNEGKAEIINDTHKEYEHKDHEYKKASEEEIENCKRNIEEFLNKFLKEFENLKYEINKNDDMLSIVISGDDAGKLIGYRGDVINALQTILSAIGNKNIVNRVRISLDIAQYKEKREETLKELANKLERTVKKTGKKIVLEPMTAYERKIIHTELQDSEFVTTYSIGEEPRRKVVVEKK